MLEIRKAEETDIPLILDFIKLIAEYEKLSHEVFADEHTLRETLFKEKSTIEVLLAYEDEEPAGYAIYFHNFSTFIGRQGIYLEDLFVKPHLRGKGIGKKLLLEIVKKAKEKKCGRVEWSVLNWNTPAIDFYKSLGALPMDGWTVFRLTEEKFDALLNK